MTKLISIFISLFYFTSIAQEVDFPLDEHGKYAFSEVVELPGMKKESLYENGLKFSKKVKVLNSKKKFLFADKENDVITNRGSFYVYSQGSIKKAIAGAVEYNFKLEFKDGKYRYTIDNFVFNEYKRNRYGKYEPVKGKYKPLEMEVSSLNRKEWDKQRQVVYDKTQEMIGNLYGDMVHVEESKKKKKKKEKKDDDW